MAIKDKFINSKPTDVKDRAIDQIKDAASDELDSAKEAVGGLEEKAKEKAKEEAKEAVDKGLDALQALVEEKAKEVIQKLGASPEQAETVIALVKENVPDEAKSAVPDAVKKII